MLEQRAARPQRADAGRPEHLVARERHEVDAQRLHVHRAVRHALRRVKEHERPGLVGRARDLLDGIDRHQHVRDVHEPDELDASVLEQARQGRAIQLAVVRDRQIADLDPALLAQHVPGHQVRVMFHLGEQDRVAGLEARARPAVRDEVDRLGAVAREHDLARRRGVDEPRDPATRVLVGGGRLLGDPVDPAMDVGVVGRVVAIHRQQNFVGLLRRRGAVEVDQRLVARLAEDRELGAHRPRIEPAHRGGRDRPARMTMHHVRYPIFFWIASRSCSRTLSSVIRSITGAKNPSTIRRGACGRGSPRAIR
jgi:hypothetical protein